ncbi:MAG TPA: hypothetical protein VNW90_00650 [Acetobacteraceae bacterium]|nr:hypothetical protein [Acetobacteraceae bacterium]
MTKPSSGAELGLYVLTGCAFVLAAGCTTQPAATPIQAASSQFDGIYAGQNNAVSGWGFQCGASTYPETIAVSGGRFDYPFLVNPPRTTPVPVQIAADGTFRAQMMYGTEEFGPLTRYMNAWVTVTGRIMQGELDATVTDLRCVRRLTAQRG